MEMTMAHAEQPALMFNFGHIITFSGNILQFIQARVIVYDESGIGEQDRGHGIDTSQAAFFALDRSLSEWRHEVKKLVEKKFGSRKDAEKIVKDHYGELFHRLFIGDKEEIRKNPLSPRR
ncbi:hypothetical protein BGZ65_007770, partial [Modicella reniformis]